MVDSRPDPRSAFEVPALTSAVLTKPRAARVAAARFATDLIRAVAEYARLTDRPAPLTADERRELEEEFHSLLPAFRRPTFDAATEYRLFVDPDRGPEDDGPAAAHPSRQAYFAYVRLVRGRGLGRRAALAQVREQFAFADEAAALAALRAEREAVIRRWQQSAPCLVQTLLDERWRDLLPEE